MAKRKVTPMSEDAENPAPTLEEVLDEAGKAKAKRTRRGQEAIIIDRLKKRYGDYAELQDALKTVCEGVRGLEDLLKKCKKSKRALPTETELANMPEEQFQALMERIAKAKEQRQG